MGVAVHQGDVAIGQDARLQRCAGGKEALVELAPLGRQAIAQVVGEALECAGMALHRLARTVSASSRVPISPPSRGSSHHAAWKRASVCTMRRHSRFVGRQRPLALRSRACRRGLPAAGAIAGSRSCQAASKQRGTRPRGRRRGNLCVEGDLAVHPARTARRCRRPGSAILRISDRGAAAAAPS